MPKERIADEAEMWDLMIAWGANGQLQVGIESHNRRALIDILVGDAIPRETLDKLLGEGSLPDFTGLWCNLDRDKSNHLIRTTRRGRDTAFGRDE